MDSQKLGEVLAHFEDDLGIDANPLATGGSGGCGGCGGSGGCGGGGGCSGGSGGSNNVSSADND